MNSLTFFSENGIEIFIDNQTGESFVSPSGYSRMSGVRIDTISKRVKQLNFETRKTTQIVTGTGFKTVELLPAKTVFKWALKDNLELAEKMGEFGATAYLHQIAGYKITSTAIAPPVQEQKYLPCRVLDRPDPWERMYSKEFCDRVFRWFGGNFYWQFCYYFMTPEEKAKHERLNPIMQRGRKYKVHQFLEPKTKERLTKYVIELNALVAASTSKQQFLTLYANYFGFGWQQELF